MTEDARFEDGGESPLRLWAVDAEDLAVVSALSQDAVFPSSEMRWSRKRRQLALLINRFRWEDPAGGGARPAERVRSLLVIDGVDAVKSQGVSPGDKESVLSLLSVTFEPGEDARGQVVLTLAGDGVIAAEVEALDVVLRDVTRPYIAPSRRAPGHPE